MNQPTNPTCRKCNGECKKSKALKPVGLVQTDSGEGFFWSDAVGIIDCQKCEECGHSFTVGTGKQFFDVEKEFAELERQIKQQSIARPIDHDQQ